MIFYKILCAFAFIFLSLTTHANGPVYYHYDNKKLSLSNERFNRYARPQLKSMLTEYFYILKKINTSHEDLIKVMKQIFIIELAWKESQKICLEGEVGDCEVIIRSLYKEARSLDKVILKVKTANSKFNMRGQSLDSALIMSQVIDDIANKNYRFLHFLESYQISLNTPYYISKKSKKLFTDHIHNMLLNSEVIITSLLPSSIKYEFEFAWTQFFKPIKTRIIYDNNKKLLLERLEEYNIAWNTFHMKISSKNNKLPKNIKNTIKIMHNRWNSVLKIILNQ